MQRTEVVMPKGINKDLSPYELPMEMWSDGNNINFRRMRTNASMGYSNPFALDDTVVHPTFCMYFSDNVDTYLLYVGTDEGGDSRIYKTDGTLAEEIGSVAYPTTRLESWTGCNFNAALLVNSREHVPQVILYPYNAVVDMPNWDVTVETPGSIWGANSKCEVIRPYKNYLIAMDCYDHTGNRFANMVRWSGPASLGEMPLTWNPDVAGSAAGVYNLADTPGRVVDGLTLGDYFVIYKTDSVWLMQFIGGTFTMKFRKLFGDDAGAYSKDCIQEYEGKHFVLGSSGVYVHNGSTKEEIMDNWVKDELFFNMNPEYASETKVVADHSNSEMWIYFISKEAPIGVNGPYADVALIWNWREQLWSKRSLNGISYICQGYADTGTGVDDWDSATGTWDEETEKWNGNVVFNNELETLFLADNANRLFLADEYTDGNGQYKPSSFVKRIGIDMNDDRTFKHLTRVVPHVQGEVPINITIYMSDTQTSSPSIAAEAVFNPLVDQDIDCHCVGRYIGIKFEAQGPWTLNGYTLEWTPEGMY